MLLCDQYITARSLDEAFDAMEAYRGRHRLIAGATDTYPWAREGRAGDVHIPTLIDIGRIPELNARNASGARVRLGAMTAVQRFLDDDMLARTMPALPRCAVWFADDQIRELATVGGNIVNASPAADVTPCLMAHDGVVELASRQEGKIVRRSVKLDEFITGPGKTGLEDNEILVAVECDVLPGYGGSFEKVGHRRSLVISVVCLATAVKLDPAGRIFEDVRMCIAGTRPVPKRIVEIEDALRGKAVSADLIEHVAGQASDLVQSRTRQEYRRDVTRGFIVRGLMSAVKRAGSSALTPELEAAYA